MPYSIKGGSLPGLFTTQDEQLHKVLKNPVAPIYSLSNVMTFERFIDEVSEIFFKQLDERFADSPVTFDLGEWLHYYSFDVMGTLSFSKRYGFLEAGKDVNGLIEAVWGFWKVIAPVSAPMYFLGQEYSTCVVSGSRRWTDIVALLSWHRCPKYHGLTGSGTKVQWQSC